VDIIAARKNLVFCVDCKKWSGGRYKKSGIKKRFIFWKILQINIKIRFFWKKS
jgi:hypothetical protein